MIPAVLLMVTLMVSFVISFNKKKNENSFNISIYFSPVINKHVVEQHGFFGTILFLAY